MLEIALHLFEIRESVKMFHWTTEVYAHHKSSDQFIAELDKSIDELIEILQGSRKTRIDIKKIENVNVYPVDKENIISYLKIYKIWLLNDLTKSIYNTEVDALSIRDKLVKDVNLFVYLLSFS